MSISTPIVSHSEDLSTTTETKIRSDPRTLAQLQPTNHHLPEYLSQVTEQLGLTAHPHPSFKLSENRSLAFIGYWKDFNMYDTNIYMGVDWGALPVNLLSVQVFGKRGGTEDFCCKLPSHYRQFYPQQAYRSIPESFHTYSLLVSNENQFVNVYLRHCLDHYVDYVDLALGFIEAEQVSTQFNNYLKFPCYLTSIFRIIGIPTLAELKTLLADLEAKRRANPATRKYISCMVARHNAIHNLKGVRDQLISLVEAVYPHQSVFCLGQYRNNTKMLTEQFADDKLACLSQFIFNICPENTWTPGYITEKIMDCLLAGCLPIYWGGITSEADIFNLDAILYYNPRKPQELKQQLQSFYDEQVLAEFIARPIFMPGAAQRIFCRYIAPLMAKLQRDLNIDSSHLREFNPDKALPEGDHWQDDYQQAQTELEQLGMSETQYEYLLTEEYQWPFLMADEILVQQQYYQLHQQAQYPVEKLAPYHQVALTGKS